MINLGIIGCGQISERFLDQIEMRNDARFVATCARHLESAERKAEKYGIERWFDNYERMMDEVNLDGVVVATPHSLHADPAIKALQRGLHVLTDKPMATSLEDCYAMVKASDDSGAILMCLPFDHTPEFLTALEYLNEDTLGKFTGAESMLLLPGPPRDNWYYDKSIAQGGALLDCLVYPMSRLISLLGPATNVTAMVNTLIPQRIVADEKRVNSDVDDNVTLIVEWAGGQQAVVRVLWGTSFRRYDTAVFGRKGTLWLIGDDIIVHSSHRQIADSKKMEWRGINDCYYAKPQKEIQNESVVDHFVNCIRDKQQAKCSGKLQLHVHEILFKAYCSAQTGKTQKLETTFTPWHKVDPAFYDTRSGWI